MKKGFTLVEMLAVIIILGIIAVITIPRIQDVLSESKNSAYDLVVTNIKAKANDYIVDQKKTSLITSTTDLNITINELLLNKYIDNEDLKDPRSGDKYYISGDSYVRFYLDNGEIKEEAIFTTVSI